jgi:pimeloyl-ACP methyl ester carboxylesterase
MFVSKVQLASSPLVPGQSPVTICCHEAGVGPPIVLLHGGWGQQLYPFDAPIDELANRYRMIAPDRSGYGHSVKISDLPGDFHHRAAAETFAVVDELGLDRIALWGHSDGAVIAVLMALAAPERICGIVLEALHLWRAKPSSRAFFQRAVDAPATFGQQVASTLSSEHGPEWQRLVSLHGRAWLRIAEAAQESPDLYDGRLGRLRVPALVVHGARDPRTEPGELDAIRAALPDARFLVLEEGEHSPHSEAATASIETRAAADFFDTLSRTRRAARA